jgi:hypothetical protein
MVPTAPSWISILGRQERGEGDGPPEGPVTATNGSWAARVALPSSSLLEAAVSPVKVVGRVTAGRTAARLRRLRRSTLVHVKTNHSIVAASPGARRPWSVPMPDPARPPARPPALAGNPLKRRMRMVVVTDGRAGQGEVYHDPRFSGGEPSIAGAHPHSAGPIHGAGLAVATVLAVPRHCQLSTASASSLPEEHPDPPRFFRAMELWARRTLSHESPHSARNFHTSCRPRPHRHDE